MRRRSVQCCSSEPQGASRGCLVLAFPRCGTSVRAAVFKTRHPLLAPSDSRTKPSHRAGYTLVFFAMLMFALMGLAALVIDIGFAKLTQRQMQTAVDSAAVEGLRWKDLNEWEEVPRGWLRDPAFIAFFDVNEDFIGTIANDVDKDRIRRWAAQQVVLSTFDDDLEPGNGDDGAFDGGGQFGAGPVVELSGGVGDPIMNASQLLTIPTTPFYKPAIEQNLGNEIHGDMVAGAYDAAETIHDEDSTYVRTDFDLTDDDAFLVRLRRTNDFDGLDNIAGESTSGPPLPYLFGRGSLLAFRDPATTYSPRHHGMTVRATGIADARPVVTIGASIDSNLFPSVIPELQVAGYSDLAMSLNPWVNLPLQSPKEVYATDAGQVQMMSVTYATSVSGATLKVDAQTGFPDPSAPGNNVYPVWFPDPAWFPNPVPQRTLLDIDDSDPTLWTLDAPVTGLPTRVRVWVDEADCGIHVHLLLQEAIDSVQTVIKVNSTGPFIDPNAVPEHSFTFEICTERFRLIDIDNADPSLWIVERGVDGTTADNHSRGEDLFVRDSRITLDEITAGQAVIRVKSLMAQLDPNGDPAAMFMVVIHEEILRVEDIDLDTNGLPTIWRVQPETQASHSAGAALRLPSFGTFNPGLPTNPPRHEAGLFTGLNRATAAVDSLQTSLAVDIRWGQTDPNGNHQLAFKIRVDDEWMRVLDFDDGNPTVWTVERGIAGTQATTHAAQTVVRYSLPISVGDQIHNGFSGGVISDDTRSELRIVCPIYNQLAGDRIVGFGHFTRLPAFSASLPDLCNQLDDDNSIDEQRWFRIVRGRQRIVTENASGTFARSPQTVTRNYVPEAPLAPVSVR
jgi:hypothetical protein